MNSSASLSRQKAAQTQRKRADTEIDNCIAAGVPFGFRKIVAHAEWDGHLRQVVVQCKCGKLETVKYSSLKTKIKEGKMRQCRQCGRDSLSGDRNPYFSGGGKRGDGVDRATRKYKREHPNCERCGSNVNVHVDHKEPVSRRPDLAASPENFESLCAPCHAEKTESDGMGHVVAMLLNGTKSTATLTKCLHCEGPMFTYSSRVRAPKFCSRVCKGLSMRKLSQDKVDQLVADYLAGGISTLSLGEKYGVSQTTAMDLIEKAGVSREESARIGNMNRIAAKRTELARSSARAKANGRSKKLTEAGVSEIKRLLLSGKPRKDIAREFNVCDSTVDHIATGRRWSWVMV